MPPIWRSEDIIAEAERHVELYYSLSKKTAAKAMQRLQKARDAWDQAKRDAAAEVAREGRGLTTAALPPPIPLHTEPGA